MITETYSPTFLASRTLPIDGVALARQIGWVRAQATMLMKSVVKTPMSGGKVDYDSVPNGASIWVTVKDESSPMHGRPILITKRPDGHFALEGGSGVSHWHDDPERERKIAARRHLVLNVKHPQQADADKAKAKAAPDEAKIRQQSEERATAKAARDDAARQTREAVGIQDEPRLGRKGRDKIAEAATGKLQEHGLSPEEAAAAAKHVPAAVQEAKHRVIAHNVAQRIDAAHNASGGRLARTDDHQPAQDQVSQGFRDRGDDLPAHGASSVAVNHAPIAEAVKRAKAAKGGDLSQPEMEQTVKEAVHSQVDDKLSRDTSISGASDQVKPNFIDKYDGKARYDDDYKGPRWTYGLNLRPLDPFGMPKGFIYQSDRPSDKFRHGTVDYPYKLSKEDEERFSLTPAGQSSDQGEGDLPIADVPAWKPSSPEEATNAVKTFQREAEARGFKAGDVPADDVHAEGQQTVPARSIDRTLVDAEGLSDTAYDALMDQYRQSARSPSFGAFYKALGEHWGDARQYAASLSGHVSRGAGEAWRDMARYGMSSDGIDVPKLVDKLGVEAAAHVMAAATIEGRGAKPEQIDQLVKTIARDNIAKVQAMEQDTLNRHDVLQRDAKGMETALEDGYGDDHEERAAGLGPKGLRVRAERQRLYAENINAQRSNLGGALGHMQFRATFLDALERFGRAAKAGTGSVGVPVALTFGDDEDAADEAMKNFRAGQGAIQKLHDTRHGWTLQVDASRLQGYVQKLKAQDTTAAAQRKTQADETPAHDYKVPGQADTVDDGQGGQAHLAWTPMQRNDVEFLHKGGGGVLAGSRGGGKRVAALGWVAKQIAENARFKGVVTTDQGGADVWAKLARERFPTMRVTAIPPDASGSWVESALQDMPHWPNGVLIVGHHQLSQKAHDHLARLVDGGHIQGHVIDNPPTEGWGRTKHLTDHAHEVSQISANSGVRRVALTDHHPVEQPQLATQLASWTHPEEFTGQDHKRARDAGEHLGQPTPANDDAIQRQVVKNLSARVASEPFARPAPPPEDPKAAARRLSREAKQAQKVVQPPTEEEALRSEWHDELERAVQGGNDDEAQAILGMAPHYGWGADEAALAHQKIKGSALDEEENRKDSGEMDQIEQSPYFSVFHHFNRDGRLKKVNPYTGKKLLGRDKSGRLGQSTAEPWEMEGAGYDQVASEALSASEGGHSQKYGMDSGDFWREATKSYKRYQELKQRLTASRTAANQKVTAVGGGAAKRKEIAGIFAPKVDKDVPTGPANTPVGMLPGTPKLSVGGASYTPITKQPEGDTAAHNRSQREINRAAAKAAQAPPSPEPFKLQMQYGGLKPGQIQSQKEEDAGQGRMDMGVPQVRVRRGMKKSLYFIGGRR